MFLSLPLISKEVPEALELCPNHDTAIRLALAMSRCGMISVQDVARLPLGKVNHLVLCGLIEKGWRRELAGSIDFSVLSAFTRLVLPHPGSPDFQVGNEDAPVAFMLGAQSPRILLVGEAFSAIEALLPGLGQTALRILEKGLLHYGHIYTPVGALEMAQTMYWMGEEDESAAIAEYGGEENEVPRRADLFMDVPEWAYCGYGRGLSAQAFAEAAVRFAGEPVGKLLEAVLHLLRLESNPAGFVEECVNEHGDYADPCQPPVVLGWGSESDFMQIFDDFYAYNMESGECPEWVGGVRFFPTDEGIAESLPLIRNTCSILGAIDRCLVEIGNFRHEL